jgi:O-succinylbenzoic acid--CoA ligase
MNWQIPWSANLANLAMKQAEKFAVVDGLNQTLTYSQLNQRAHDLACYLISQGIKPGDRVASCLPNCIEAVWVSYGIKLSGAAETPLNWRYTSEELQWCQQLAGFKWIVSQHQQSGMLKQLGLSVIEPGLIPSVEIFDQLPAVDGQCWGRLLFTSGTTGKPKAVVYNHLQRWQGELMQKAALPFVPAADEKILLMTPFVHGASMLTFAWLDHAAQVILLDGMDLEKISLALDDEQLKAVFAPPTVLAKLCAEFQGKIKPQLKCIFTGTQPLPQSLYQKAVKIFGPVVRITYGKTECINPITVLSAKDTDLFYNEVSKPAGCCVGYPATGVEIRIQAASGSESTSPDSSAAEGEVWIRAPQMSLGLLDSNGLQPHEPQGWHASGDLGYFDSKGRLLLTGRIADVIKTGGYRVNPDEIETRLSGLDGVSAICVTSLPSEYWGEIIVAVAESQNCDWIEQAKQDLKGLSRYKQPRIFVNLNALPRNQQGKISRKLVAQVILNKHKLIDGAYPALNEIIQP